MEAAITEYSPTVAALAEFAKKYKDVAYPVSTPTGFRDAIAARAEIRGVRVALEKERTKIKAPALERCQMIDAEAKRITRELLALETPIDQQIKAEEERKEAIREAKAEAERQRVEAIQARIDIFRNITASMSARPSYEITEMIDNITNCLIEGHYSEFDEIAQAAKDNALLTLGVLLAGTLEQEAERVRIEADRAELARLREEQIKREAEAEKQRIDAERLRLAEEENIRAARAVEEKAIAEARAADQAKIDAERKAEEERQRVERAAHEAKMKAEQEEADKKRREADAKQAELDRQAAQLERQRLEQEEQTRLLAARRILLTEARRDDPRTALIDILALAENVADHPNHQQVRAQIALIAEASIPTEGKKTRKAA